jgi:hypothetical protein
MALAGVVLGVLSGIDVKPRAEAPMAELRRRAVGSDGAWITYAIFIRVRRDVCHFLPLARWQGKSHLRTAGSHGELADMARRGRAQEGYGLLRARYGREADRPRKEKRCR